MERAIDPIRNTRPALPDIREEDLHGQPRLVYDPYRQEFWLQCPFDRRDIPKRLGFSWDAVARRWTCKDIYPAFAAIQYAHDKLRQWLADALQKHETQVDASRATHSAFEPPAPRGLEYLPFQKAGIAYAHKRRACLIGDDMGLGKTIQALGLINLLAQEKHLENPNVRLHFRALIVCPASLKLNWLKELRLWVDKRLTYGIAEGKKLPRACDIIVINYDILKAHADRLLPIEWDIVVLDEAHYIKNAGTNRAKAAGLFRDKGARKLMLTGTPIENRPSELYNLLHWLDPETYNSQFAFMRRYCGGVSETGKMIRDGASNLEELNARLRSSVMIRRLKSEVLTELPPKRRQIIELPAMTTDLQRAVEAEQMAFHKQEATLSPLRDAINRAVEVNDTAAYADAVKRYRHETFKILGQIATERRQLAVLKAPLVVQHLHDCIDSSIKVVVFAHHHEVMNILKAAFKDRAVAFDGKMTLADREKSVERFQQESKVQLFIGSIHAAGVGITLTASSHCVFAELDWVPGKVIQSEDRLNRIGQRNSVLVQHMVVEKSLDAKMVVQMIAKQEIIERAIDGGN